ncbi:MAG: outer membrane beta-barrel protein [Saprospiraceae bacterium]|nr:outer membrane beta-barrel protein [Saprospiraceae bacterium]
MKKLPLLLLFFVLSSAGIITSGLKAQDLDNLRIGFQLSPTMSWMRTNNTKITSQGSTFGFKIGIAGEYFFSKKEYYSLTAGLNLAMGQGGRLLYGYAGNFLPNSSLSESTLHALPIDSDIKYKLQYIEIPIGLKMRTNEIGYLRYFAELPIFTLGFLTQGRGDITTVSTIAESENIKPDIAPINLYWGVGGGAEYNLTSNTSLIAGLYFQQSILDITRNKNATKVVDGSNVKEDSKATGNSIVLRLGFAF